MAPSAIVAILAGGRGSRMGSSKPATLLGPMPLVAYPIAAARQAGLEPVVIAKRDTALPPLDCELVFEADHPHHPLRGLLAALDVAGQTPQRACVAVACDMPFLSAPLLSWLAEMQAGDGQGAQNGHGGEALVAQVAGRLQPLLARYLPPHRGVLGDALARGLTLTAAVRALEPEIASEQQLRVFGDPLRLCFSVDSEQDLETASRWL
jgi:molybdopterin-guanine dinucleotide biosynthesis protein A